MIKYISLLLITILSLNVSAQENKAKTILDKVSAINKKHTSVKAEFAFNMDNAEEDVHESSNGNIILKGNKYRLYLMNVYTYFDGKTIYQHLVDAEEVNIKEPDEDDEEAGLNPTQIFSLYETGFKFNYIEEQKIASGTVHVIDLFPLDEERPFSKIRLNIDTKSLEIKSLVSIGKDGNNITIKIKKFEPNVKFKDSDFVFDQAANPDVEVVDMR
ncbi:outer membrane lipoprotein carrier protein LolA [Ancylomarina sp. 16SWW S1-10-2]|uniref:LolA family protein n=1 Tax=Ancylomarina sp. 16SWW S1-10-2 TaxID=2499681 RepID=UPI0012ADED73|nr:outer membrane lipoprotein carrier protein LolA [Ancylomarina sp. 16SWW S1-10-2]MRT94835.1 outer membrane lipoprotein carrier protein LolA [Ancylomarina sp. 16SWW S1-10-2]